MTRAGRTACALFGRAAVLASGLVVASCGREEHLAREQAHETSGEETVHAPHAGCPAAFSDPGPSCEGSDVVVTGCDYPEGTCSCGTATWCGGAAPPPMPRQWICHPHRPPCAVEGTPCDTPGASCAHDGCGFVGVRCEEGVWRGFQGPYPP